MPVKAFNTGAEIFHLLIQPKTISVLNHIMHVMPTQWTTKELHISFIKKFSIGQCKTTVAKLVDHGLVKKERIGKSVNYSFNHDRYEQICGAAARLL